MERRNWIAVAAAGITGVADNRSRIVALKSGKGSGAPCVYCHKPISADQIEHEVEALVLAGLKTLRFHRVCHHLWESQTHIQEKRMSDRKQPSETTPGRPKETGSRQQRHRTERLRPKAAGESVKSSDRSASSVPLKPPGAK